METSLPSASMRVHLLGYPRRLAKIWGCILASSYCSRKTSTSKHQSVRHLHPWLGQLKDWHIQSHGHQPFPLPTPSAASARVPVACSLTCSGVSIRVQCPPVQGRGGQTPSTDCSALGLWWPSTQSRCPHMGGEPCLGHLSHPRGFSGLLRCTSHQLA